MLRYILRRVLLMIPVLLGVTLVTFILVRSIPGDPVETMLGADRRATPAQIEAMRAAYGLDQSLPVQYVKWLGHVLTGDLGTSLRTRRDVIDELALRLPVTIQLALMATVFAAIPALALGVLAAVKRNSAADYLSTIGSLVGVSVPSFFLATVFVLLFSYRLQWLPPIGYRAFTDEPIENLRFMVMPTLCLGLPLGAVLMRFTRSSVLDVLGQEHVRTARAKGLPQGRVLARHVLPNAGIPILTILGIQIANLLGGAVIIESIFGIPGVGKYVYDSIAKRDYPVVQGATLVLAFLFVVVSLVVDILYAALDPRLRRA